MKAYGLTDRGKVRRDNQDAFRFELPEGEEMLTGVVCDGMGGAQAGALASSIAVDAFMSHAANSLDAKSSLSDMRAILKDAVDYANAKVYAKAFSDLDCIGMGCTLVAVLVAGKRTMIANVGDSRAYLFYKDQLRQVTVDHSLVEDMIARGKLTREEARIHPKRNIITRAVGVDPSVKTDLLEIKFPAGAKLLLCSDGLSNVVTDDEIEQVLLEEPEPEPACARLLELALQAGAPDNVTAFLVQR